MAAAQGVALCSVCRRPLADAADWGRTFAIHGGVPVSDDALCWRALGILLAECEARRVEVIDRTAELAALLCWHNLFGWPAIRALSHSGENAIRSSIDRAHGSLMLLATGR